MTAGRHGFSDDFQIFDLQNGVPRSTRTLSGGETFLASLALALGLVEIAARAGDKLDSLFLDEGFGSLDPDTLDEALTALDERARAERLIVLISHIGAVAEHDGIQDVLEVRRAPTGSVLRWVNRGESDETLEEELRGLLPRS